jgi:hypothetical protein
MIISEVDTASLGGSSDGFQMSSQKDYSKTLMMRRMKLLRVNKRLSETIEFDSFIAHPK